MTAKLGPLGTRVREAGARARLRPGLASALASLGPRDLPLLARAGLPELAVLADALHLVPRVTGRWMLGLAAQEGAVALLRSREDWTREAFLAGAERALGWAPQEQAARGAALGVLEHLAELQLLARHDDTLKWRGEGVVRDLALPPDEEAHARELFGGTLAFYRACLDRLPEVLRGKPASLGFAGGFQGLWDGILGSPEQLALRRLGLKAAGGEPRSVLDVACGSGFSTAAIVEEWPAASVVAIDVNDANYDVVRDRVGMSAAAMARPADLTLAKPWPGWGHELPFPDASFDAVFCAMNDGFIPAHRRGDVYAELHRVLKPGGELLLVTALLPDRDWHPRPWELRAQTWFHHAAEFAVPGFQGLGTISAQAEAAKQAGFDADAGRLGGIVWVLRAPAK